MIACRAAVGATTPASKARLAATRGSSGDTALVPAAALVRLDVDSSRKQRLVVIAEIHTAEDAGKRQSAATETAPAAATATPAMVATRRRRPPSSSLIHGDVG